MPVIGTFKADKDGYSGTIRTQKKSPGAPDFRVLVGATEIGAAWRKSSENHESYLSIRLDDPSFAEPIRAALMEKSDDGALPMLWRREKRETGA